MKRFRFESFMRFIIQSQKYGTFTEAARTDPEKYSHDNLILIILGEINLSIWNPYNKFFGTTASLGVCSKIYQYTTYERKVNGFFDIDRPVGVVSP